MSKSFHGIGFNSGGKHKGFNGRKQTEVYRTWVNMLERCYCPKYQTKSPTYIGCYVSKDWYDFQDFAEWLSSHNYGAMGYVLDKDILIPNNKVYSPDTCCLVPSELNNLLVFRKFKRGELPHGVSLNKNRKRFIVHIKINSKSKHLGVFDCPNEAHQVYKKAKEAYVKEKALEWRDRIADDVFQALMNWQLTE